MGGLQSRGNRDPGKRWRIEIGGDKIQLFVDDRFKGEVEDCAYRSGYIGFWTWKNGTRISIRNLRVTAAR